MDQFSIIDPRAKLSAPDQTAYVQRELEDDGLQVLWDGQRHKFVVVDRKAPGGPDSQYVMVVQEPDGAYRPVDGRTIETLRRLKYGHKWAKDELGTIAAEREKEVVRKRGDRAQGFAEDLRWFGQAVVPSVGWRDRSAAREAIRAEAK